MTRTILLLASLLSACSASPAEVSPERLEAAHNYRASMRNSVTVQGVPQVPVAEVIDRELDGVPVRIYVPDSQPPHPILAYLHGGGFIGGDLDTHDNVCRTLAQKAQCMVVSVDYRLAPEYPYPAGVNDCYAVLWWLGRNGAQLGGDPKRLAVAGEGTGGTLAAAVSQMARDRRETPPKFQVLVRPATDVYKFASPSYQLVDPQRRMRDNFAWIRDLCFTNPEQAREPYASPLRAKHFTSLADALIVVANGDVLLDDGLAYASRLRTSGVGVEMRRVDRVAIVQGQWMAAAEPAVPLIEEVAAALRAVFAK